MNSCIIVLSDGEHSLSLWSLIAFLSSLLIAARQQLKPIQSFLESPKGWHSHGTRMSEQVLCTPSQCSRLDNGMILPVVNRLLVCITINCHTTAPFFTPKAIPTVH